MSNILNWIKNNKLLVVFLIIFFGFFFVFNAVRNRISYREDMMYSDNYVSPKATFVGGSLPISNTPIQLTSERMVITNTSLSLVVKNVSKAIESINSYVRQLGGFPINSNQNTSDDVTSGNVTVRVPTEKLDETMTYFKGLAVKIVDENVMGTDITDQYADYEERIKTLESTKIKYQDILDKATDVDDIMMVTNRIIDLQGQIDSTKGMMKYLENSSKTSLITVSLSTDEFELPYTPDTSWRPQVIFKEAVRSLIGQLRSIASALIWIAVNSVLWVPVILISWLMITKVSKQIIKKK